MYKLVIIGIALMLSFSGYAQMRINPKLGIAVSTIEIAKGNNYIDSGAAVTIGADIRTRGDFLFFLPGLHYQAYHFVLEGDATISQIDKVKIVRLPLHVGLHLTGNRGMINFHLRGGLSANFVVNIDKENFLLTKDNVNGFNTGLGLGLGLDVWRLAVDVQLESGLTNFISAPQKRNGLIFFNIGFAF